MYSRGCCNARRDRRREVTMLFDRARLVYDIENCCYIEGDTLARDADVHQRHCVTDVGQEGNEDRMGRMLELCYARCVELLYKYSRHEVWRDMTTNAPDEREVLALHMRVPETFSQTTVDYLTKLVHNLIVALVVADWLSITKPEAAARWAEKAQLLEEDIKRSLNSHFGRARIRQHPF